MTKHALGVCRFDDVAGFSTANDFGTSGLAVTAVPGFPSSVPHGIVLDGRQRPVIVGTAARNTPGANVKSLVVLARYQPNGELDRRRKIINASEPDRFDDDGLLLAATTSFANVRSSTFNEGRALARAGNSYYVAGSYKKGSGSKVLIRKFGATAGENNTFGSDSAFGNDGSVVTDIPETPDEQGIALAVGSDKRVWIAADTVASAARRRIGLVCYQHTGILDTGVGNGGVVIIEGNTVVGDVLADRNRLLVAGQRSGNWCIWKRRPDGAPDTPFGSNGMVFGLPLGSGWRARTCDALVFDERGRILAAGTAHKGTDRQFVVARYQPDGTLDTSFGTGGMVQVGISSAKNLQASAIAEDRAGRIVVCGSAVETATGRVRPAVVRLLADGTLDRSFSGNGKAYGPAQMYAPTGLAIDRNNRILLCAPVECERLVEHENEPGFIPSVHGLRYENETFHQQIDSIGGGNLFAGLTVCGGMSLAARDYFLSNRVTPDRRTQPGARDFFRRYVMQRQLDTLGWDGVLPTERPLEFLRQWLRLPRQMPWRKEFATWHTHNDDEDLLRWSTKQLFNMSQATRTQHRLVLTGVVYHDAEKIFDNHQILAIGMSGADVGTPAKRKRLIDHPSLSRLVRIHVYDPNFPGENHRYILVKMKVVSVAASRRGSSATKTLTTAWATLACFGETHPFTDLEIARVMDGRETNARKRREVAREKMDLRGFFLMDPSGFRNRPGVETVDPGTTLA